LIVVGKSAVKLIGFDGRVCDVDSCAGGVEEVAEAGAGFLVGVVVVVVGLLSSGSEVLRPPGFSGSFDMVVYIYGTMISLRR
jgi:hypothetical protein